MLSCLAKLKDDVVVFHHEDMFLHAKPDHETLKYFENIVKQDQVSFIKLLRGGYVDTLIESEYSGLVISPEDMVFTIQPTICKKTLRAVWLSTVTIRSEECITTILACILILLQVL